MSTGQNTLPNAQDALRSYQVAYQQMVFTRQATNAALVDMRAIQDVTNQVPASAQNLLSLMDGQASSYATAMNRVVNMFAPTVGQSGLSALFTYMADNSIEIKSRGTVYGSPVAGGSNVGNAVLLVCSKNYLNQIVESATIETLTFRLTVPSFSLAAAGTDTYQVTGGDKAAFSSFQMDGPGIAPATVTSIAPGITNLINNPSFDDTFIGSGGSDVNKIPSWFIAAGPTNITQEVDDEAFDRGGSQASLNITGDCKIQFFFRNNGIQIPEDTPLAAGLMWKADASAGDIIIRVGSVTGTYTATQATSDTSNAWQLFTLDIDDDDAWALKFNTDGNPVFEIEIDNYTSGTINIDDVVFNSATNVGGRWVAIVSGAVQGVIGDTQTHTTSLTTGSGSVSLDSGASGSVDSITVNGVELLRSAIPFNSSLNQTAADVGAEINDPENMTSPQYRATVATDTVTIIPVVPEEGTLTVVSTATTIGTTDTNITGGSLGLIQDSLVRTFGTYLPHASSATSSWGDT